MVLYVSTSKYSRTFQNYNEKLGQAQKLSVLLQPGTTALHVPSVQNIGTPTIEGKE